MEMLEKDFLFFSMFSIRGLCVGLQYCFSRPMGLLDLVA